MGKSNLNQLLDKIEENIGKSKIDYHKLDNTHMYSMPLGDYMVEITPIPTMGGLYYRLRVKSPANEEVLEISHFNSSPEDYQERVRNIFWKIEEAETGKEPEHIIEAKKIEEQRQAQIRDFNAKYEAVVKKVLESLD